MKNLQYKKLFLSRVSNADIRLVDDGISRLHCRVRLLPDGLFVEDLASRNGTFCNGQKVTKTMIKDGDKLQLGRTTILKFTFQDRMDESFQQRMLDSALRDPLTSVYNKRYFGDRLASEFHFATRHNSHLAVLLLDLDRFKAVNDTYGHLAGDKVLVGFAELLNSSIRNEDVLARYGGEEFVIISRQISQKDVLRFADRLRKQTELLAINYEDKILKVTCSIGVATYPELVCERAEQLVDAADRALYVAKSSGRNRVCVHPSEFEQQKTTVDDGSVHEYADLPPGVDDPEKTP
jgi:diguanylate cyclase (GGDEF)-like protein